MDDKRKIHLLSQELIPVINDLDAPPKQIVLDHIKSCAACQQLYTNVVDFDNSFPEADIADEPELKPLKKLVQFNLGLKLLLIFIRIVILFYIIYSGINYYDLEFSAVSAIEYIQSTIFLFYLPATIFLFIFTITFFNKKWIYYSLIADILVILFLDNLIKLFL